MPDVLQLTVCGHICSKIAGLTTDRYKRSPFSSMAAMKARSGFKYQLGSWDYFNYV